ncbi:MAG: hypothetical protein JNL08_09945 [Planctomycetes bacterium]|nr:hypothetical protein [Planctomycetota bacterium]
MRLPLLAALALSVPSFAQEETFASRFRVQLGFGGGEFEHRTDGSNLDDDTDAALLRFHFEGTTRRGFGGGVRFEGLASDDDLFEDAGFNSSEARLSSFLLHLTWRAQARRFSMPVRFGLWFNGYLLEDQVLDEDVSYGTLGPWLEVAPEFRLVDSRKFSWSLFAELGAGIGVTGIDVENDANDYVSTTSAVALDVGTRLRGGPFELGLAFVNRWQSMDESDEEDGLVVLGYDTEFHGLLITCSAVF